MASKLSADESIALIHENLQEVLKPEIIEDVIRNQKRPLVIYWGRQFLPVSSSQPNALRTSPFFYYSKLLIPPTLANKNPSN